MSEKLIARSYKFPQETIDQLDALNGKMKDKTIRDIIVEAVSIMAEEHGIGERVEHSYSMDSLAKKVREQDVVIKALCKTCIMYEQEYSKEKVDLNAVDKLVEGAIASGTPAKPKALWDALKKKLPKTLTRQPTNFKLYLGLRGFPRLP